MDDTVEETAEEGAGEGAESVGGDAPDAPAADAPPAVDVDALIERLQAAERRADELAAVSRRQADMADELHKENRRLRDGELREATAPLIRGLARVIDDIARIRVARPDDEDVAHIDARVREVLHDAGADTVRPEPGDAFDARIHQAAGSAVTTDKDADRTVAEVRREGIVIHDDRMLRPADVVVYRFKEDK